MPLGTEPEKPSSSRNSEMYQTGTPVRSRGASGKPTIRPGGKASRYCRAASGRSAGRPETRRFGRRRAIAIGWSGERCDARLGGSGPVGLCDQAHGMEVPPDGEGGVIAGAERVAEGADLAEE